MSSPSELTTSLWHPSAFAGTSGGEESDFAALGACPQWWWVALFHLPACFLRVLYLSTFFFFPSWTFELAVLQSQPPYLFLWCPWCPSTVVSIHCVLARGLWMSHCSSWWLHNAHSSLSCSCAVSELGFEALGAGGLSWGGARKWQPGLKTKFCFPCFAHCIHSNKLKDKEAIMVVYIWVKAWIFCMKEQHLLLI